MHGETVLLMKIDLNPTFHSRAGRSNWMKMVLNLDRGVSGTGDLMKRAGKWLVTAVEMGMRGL